MPGLEVGNESNMIFNAMRSYYGTGTNAAAVGRAASDVSVATGVALEAYSAFQVGVISQASGAEIGTSYRGRK